MRKKGLICYELNEVPWRVLDTFVRKFPRSFLAGVIDSCEQFITITEDEGELHPWTTWPTMHRGVCNTEHRLQFINQDKSAAVRFPPIWEVLADNGVSIGVFGSLQSYPPYKSPSTRFFVPDTFAPHANTIPVKLEAFQRFNLRASSDNKAIVSESNLKYLYHTGDLLRTGVTVSTLAVAAFHLAREKASANYKILRPLLQPRFAFDVYFQSLRQHKPLFSTFFSNHAASMMHRYWSDLYPDDFVARETRDKIRASAIMRAVLIADKQIEALYRFAKREDYALAVASSMGQEAIERGAYEPEIFLRTIDKLLELFDLPGSCVMQPAMQPDITLKFKDRDRLYKFCERLAQLQTLDGKKILEPRYQPAGTTLNITAVRGSGLRGSSDLLFNESKVVPHKIGIELITRDQGTGYHCREGSLIWMDAGLRRQKGPRRKIDSRAYFKMILEHFSLLDANHSV